MAEDRGPALGVVRADSLEDPGSVMERVRQYVPLRVLPGDELSVHPDEVRGVHVLSPLTGWRGPPWWRPLWSRRRPGPASGGQRRALDRRRILLPLPRAPCRVRT